MSSENSLIGTMVFSLVFAAFGGYAALRLKLSPLVGYLFAGMFVGPFTPGFIADAGLARQLAEIGVMFLMFGVGMHFSMRELAAVRQISIPGALGQIVITGSIATLLGTSFGWALPAAAIFGLSLSVASTVVVLRTLEARGLLQSTSGQIAIGWLIVEDIVMIVALVLLPTIIAVSERFGGGAITSVEAWSPFVVVLGKLLAFLGLMLLLGRRLFPWLVEHVERTGSRELFTLAIVALALGVATGSARLFGLSFALGAFFAGVLIHESAFSRRAAVVLKPLEDTFVVLFFVAVGMLFDPNIIVAQPLNVALVVLVILFSKALAARILLNCMKAPSEARTVVPATLAQIGEFSFILCGLGVQLGALPKEGFDLVLAGALLSILLNPLMFRFAAWMGRSSEPDSARAELAEQKA